MKERLIVGRYPARIVIQLSPKQYKNATEWLAQSWSSEALAFPNDVSNFYLRRQAGERQGWKQA